MHRIIALLALCSWSALAQETPPPPPPAEPTHAATDAPMEDEGGRMRFGGSLGIGWHIPSPALVFGGEARVGWQFSRMFSLFGAFGGSAGLGFGVSLPDSLKGASVSITAISYYYFAAIAELVFGDRFYVGGGPVLASGAYVGATVAADASTGATGSVATTTAVGFKPGLDLRLGLGFGRPNPAHHLRRWGFNLGIDALILLHPNALITTVSADSNGNAGVGVDSRGLAASVIPMLTLGFDAR